MKQQLSPGLVIVVVIVVVAIIVGVGYVVLGRKSSKATGDKGQTVPPNQMQQYMQKGQGMQSQPGAPPTPAPAPQ